MCRRRFRDIDLGTALRPPLTSSPSRPTDGRHSRIAAAANQGRAVSAPSIPVLPAKLVIRESSLRRGGPPSDS